MYQIFFRHPHPIYFSIEKLFRAMAAEIGKQRLSDLPVKEFDLPLTSSISSILKNISFVRRSQTQVNHITGDVHYTILGCSKKNINVLTAHDCVLPHHYRKANPRHWIIRWLWYL